MYQRILMPIDGSPASEAALIEAIRLARLSAGGLRLLHLYQPKRFLPESVALDDRSVKRAMAELHDAVALLRRGADRVRRSGVRVDTRFIEGEDGTLQEIVAREVAAWPAEIVVMGTHGRRGLGRLVRGSDAESVIRRSDVPVLLVRCADEGSIDRLHARAMKEERVPA